MGTFKKLLIILFAKVELIKHYWKKITSFLKRYSYSYYISTKLFIDVPCDSPHIFVSWNFILKFNFKND